MKNGNSPIMTIRQVAEYLGVHPSTIYRLMKDSALPGFRVGSDYRFRRETIDQWIAKQEAAVRP